MKKFIINKLEWQLNNKFVKQQVEEEAKQVKAIQKAKQ